MQNKIWKLILILAGMSGVRLDRGKVLYIWIPLAILSYFLNIAVGINGWWLQYTIFGFTFFYVGLIFLFGSPIRPWLIKTFGTNRAISIYEVVLGMMLLNGGFAVAQFIYAHQNTMNVPFFIWPIAVLIFILSFGSKVWATWLTGLDTYYCRDLFLNKKSENFVKTGPYKYFNNPMYGIGYLYAYATALIMQSLEGLVFVAICQTSIYIFYYLVEKPFIIRMYISPNTS